MGVPKRLTPDEVEASRLRRLEGMRLQEIEGNPLSADQIEMFEMFECEAWSHEQCRAYLLAKTTAVAAE